MVTDDHEFTEWAKALRAPFEQETFSARLKAVVNFRESGAKAVPFLASMLANDSETAMGRVWAAITLAQAEVTDTETILAAARRALASESPTIRRATLSMLGETCGNAAVSLISEFLTDDAEDRSAWFNDDCTVRHAAEGALRRIAARQTDHGHVAGA